MSNGQLWCGTCHDPHNKPLEPVQFYRSKCLSCHTRNFSASHPAKDSNCIGCHMPRRDAKDGGHTAFTDHRIQRRPEPQPDLPADTDIAAWREPAPDLQKRNLGIAYINAGMERRSGAVPRPWLSHADGSTKPILRRQPDLYFHGQRPAFGKTNIGSGISFRACPAAESKLSAPKRPTRRRHTCRQEMSTVPWRIWSERLRSIPCISHPRCRSSISISSRETWLRPPSSRESQCGGEQPTSFGPERADCSHWLTPNGRGRLQEYSGAQGYFHRTN